MATPKRTPIQFLMLSIPTGAIEVRRLLCVFECGIQLSIPTGAIEVLGGLPQLVTDPRFQYPQVQLRSRKANATLNAFARLSIPTGAIEV